MKERTSQILESIVREFITFGEPISSERLYERYDFGIKPATLRSEMSDLTEMGFLDQPHHSAGRIPSNRGYEFYVNIAFEEAKPEAREDLLESFRDGDLKQFLEELSNDLQVLGVLGEGTENVYKEGLDNLFEGLEWSSPLEVKQVIRDFESIDERLEAIQKFDQDFLSVFVGRKSPVTKSDELSVIAGDYFINGERIFLLAIGPKRMDYLKPLRVFRGLKQLLN